VNDTFVTVVGNVVDSPRRVRLQSGSVTNFRMASTARRYDSKSQEFIDSGTLWVDVECWGDLGAHVSSSVSKGDPVIVYGPLTTHSWEGESGKRSAPRIKGLAVGPNLQRGTAEFKRYRPQRTTDPAVEQLADETPEPQHDGFPDVPDEARDLLAGRDYEADVETLQHMTADDLSPEPANA
jgi:single-strand DNA-binding protein